tara:strand:- start:92 stop:223 length:132 start_codon:yes stop_codon:yes gene_type:complete
MLVREKMPVIMTGVRKKYIARTKAGAIKIYPSLDDTYFLLSWD